jgi:hypothetical protein
MEQLQEKITNDVLNIIRKYEVDRNYDYAIVILEENMENIRKDVSLYIHTLKESMRNIITYTEQEFDIDDHMGIELTFHISNLDFKEIHSFKLPLNVALENLKTFNLNEVGNCTLYELLKDTNHEDELKHFITQFAHVIADITNESYSLNCTPVDRFSEELFYFQYLKSEHEKEIYSMAVGYTTANEALFKPIKDVVYIHGLELINVCFNRIDFIE